MKTCFLFLFVGGLVLSATELAPGQMVTRTTRTGKFVTTTIDVLQAPPVLGKQAFGKVGAKGVVLAANDWKCGRYFTDEFGRRWMLVSGLPYTEKPTAISGWLLQPENQGLNFFTVDGRLYRISNPGLQAGNLPEVVPPPKK